MLFTENGQNAIAHCPFRISRIQSFDSATAWRDASRDVVPTTYKRRCYPVFKQSNSPLKLISPIISENGHACRLSTLND